MKTTSKSIRPKTRAPATEDSFRNFAARIGYGSGNFRYGGSYNIQ